MTRAARALFALVLLALLASACRRRPRSDAPEGTTPVSATLPALVVRDDTPDLLLTWVDAKGDGHTVMRPSEVPLEGRDRVRVVVTTREEGTGELYWVANLTVHAADGAYPVTTLPAHEWDALLDQRRRAAVAARAPAPAPAASGEAVAAQVVLYGASWCGACHEAAAWLRQHHVAFVEHDIEADARAAADLQALLARTGRRGGSIPVLDVGGQVLVGFDPRALEQALARAARGTTVL